MNDIQEIAKRLSEKTEQARWALEQWNEALIDFREALIKDGEEGVSVYGLAADITGIMDGFANIRERLIDVSVSELDEL